MVLTSEKKSKIPTTGYFCDSLTQSGAELKSWDVCIVAKSQLASVILSAHKYPSILCPTQNTTEIDVLNMDDEWLSLLLIYKMFRLESYLQPDSRGSWVDSKPSMYINIQQIFFFIACAYNYTPSRRVKSVFY